MLIPRREDLAAAGPGKVLCRLARLLIIENHLRPGLAEHFHNRGANPPRTSGYDGNAAFQRHDNAFS